MKTHSRYLPTFSVPLLVACFIFGMQRSEAARRPRPANPRGPSDPRGVADPRGVGDPRTRAGRVDTLPARYETRAYGGLNYYYWEGSYYYPYSNNGETVYVPAPVVGGVPTVPPRPYVYTLPAGCTTLLSGGLKFYYWEGHYYYEYSNDGPTIYVVAPLVNGVPTRPLRPYVYALPAGFSIQSYAGVNYCYYYGYYYYVYYINGRAVYVLASAFGSAPTVPPPPY